MDAFLAQPGLPFASLPSAERIEQIFAKHDALFGVHGVYNTAVMLWSFLGQVLRVCRVRHKLVSAMKNHWNEYQKHRGMGNITEIMSWDA
jgi:hypothetical protein